MVFRVLLASLAAAILIWFSLIVTIPRVFVDSSPAFALRWAPFDAEANAGVAWEMLQKSPTPATAIKAERLARSAIRRDATNVLATRTLAVAQAVRNNPADSERLFQYAQSLSRRDFPTQLWFIEDEVKRGSVEGALHHFDIALRTSNTARAALYPILAKAITDESIARALAKLLATKPSWWREGVHMLVTDAPSSKNVALITKGLLDPSDSDQRADLQILLSRLVGDKEYSLANDLYNRLQPHHRPNTRLVRDGGFEEPSLYPPFDWSLTDTAGLAAVRQKRPGSNGFALFLVADNGRGGTVARQLLTLHPGEYKLTAVVGNVTGDALSRPQLFITCDGVNSNLNSIDFPLADNSGRSIGMDFQIPLKNCPAQWVNILIRADLDLSESSPWVDDVSIVGKK